MPINKKSISQLPIGSLVLKNRNGSRPRAAASLDANPDIFPFVIDFGEISESWKDLLE